MSTSLSSEQLALRWDFAAAFSSRLAHDLSNIFTGVNGFSELALLQLANDHPSRPYVKDVIQAGQRGIDLSQRMHLLRTCGTVQTGSASVAAVIEQVRARILGKTPAGLVIEKEVPADLPAARLGADALPHALAPLVANAAEAAGEGGRVRIEARPITLTVADASTLYGRIRPGPHVEIRVIDSGPGVADDLLARVLEAPMSTSRTGARGLGLAIVFRTVYAHEAGFALHRVPEGGTVARLCVPAA